MNSVLKCKSWCALTVLSRDQSRLLITSITNTRRMCNGEMSPYTLSSVLTSSTTTGNYCSLWMTRLILSSRRDRKAWTLKASSTCWVRFNLVLCSLSRPKRIFNSWFRKQRLNKQSKYKSRWLRLRKISCRIAHSTPIWSTLSRTCFLKWMAHCLC